MRRLLQKLFAKRHKAAQKNPVHIMPNPQDVQRELDLRLYSIVMDLRRFELSQQQIIDEMHDSIERVTGEADLSA